MILDRGVEEVVGAGGHQVAVVLLAERHIVLEGDVVLDRGTVALDRADEVLVAVGDEDRLGLDRVDHVGQLFALGAVVERHEGHTELRAGVVDDHVLGGVDGHHADVVAVREADALQGVGEHGHVGGELGEGLAGLVAEQSDAVGHVGGGDVEHVGSVHGRLLRASLGERVRMRLTIQQCMAQSACGQRVLADRGRHRQIESAADAALDGGG